MLVGVQFYIAEEKYTKEVREKAKDEFRAIFLKEPTKERWSAVEEIASHYHGIARTTLAYWAWDVNRELGLSRKGSQHLLYTDHGNLIVRLKQKFQANGYNVEIEENAIRRFVEKRGSKGHPDLLAIKGKDIALVEIIDPAKTHDKIVDQLERYSKIGRVIVVLPISTENIEFWGLQQL